jgi:tRNA(fMet)-specific endonuclease VapC
MSQYLVDTDWLIQVLHGNADATQTIEDLAPDGLATSLITYGELYHGAYYARDPQPALEALRDLLTGIEMLPLTPAIMERFAIIRGLLTRNQRQQVGDMDLLIAATALEHSLTLVTFNRRDYDLVPSLTLYEP